MADVAQSPSPGHATEEVLSRHGRLSLRFKFILWVVSLVMYLCLALGLVFVRLTEQNVREELRRRGSHMAQLLAHKSCPYILRRDSEALDFLVRSVVQDEDVMYAIVRDADGLPLAATIPVSGLPSVRNASGGRPNADGRDSGGNADILEMAASVTQEMACAWGFVGRAGPDRQASPQLGTVYLGLSTTREGKAVAVISRQLAPLILVSCLLSIIGTILAERKITKPIEELVRATRAIASGDLSLRVSNRSSDELGQLAHSFNQMADALGATMNELESYSQSLEDQVRQRTKELETKTRALQQANAELLELDRRKSGFVSDVSHELRTPLTSIRAIAEILGQQGQHLPHEQTLEFLRIIEEQTDRLTKLIADILDLSRLEHGEPAEELQPVDMAGVVSEAIRSVQGLAVERGVTIVSSVPENLPRALAHGDRVVQVLVNLLGNALRFTASDGIVSVKSQHLPTKGVWLGSPAPVSGIAVSVADTGVGIPKEELGAIFDRYRQIGRAACGTPTGSGLGLSISKEIIETLGGVIWAESEPGKGSIFHFTLRVAPSGEGDRSAEVEGGAAPASSPAVSRAA